MMDINLPLILMIAVAVTGLTWCFDRFFLVKKRRLSSAAAERRFSSLTDAEKQVDPVYLMAVQQAQKEPMLVEYSKSFFPILAIVFILRSFIIEPFKIPSESMVPTLEVGDFIVVNKFSYGIRLPVFRTKIIDIDQPKRGDVVVFFPPHEDRYFIKRLVGLPGDTIELRDNIVYVNGQQEEQRFLQVDTVARSDSGCSQPYEVLIETLDEVEHLMRKCPTGGSRWNDHSWTVPEGHYFMMGDNRDNSQDSRFWGFVPDKNIVGKAFAIWMHWGDGLPGFDRSGSIK